MIIHILIIVNNIFYINTLCVHIQVTIESYLLSLTISCEKDFPIMQVVSYSPSSVGKLIYKKMNEFPSNFFIIIATENFSFTDTSSSYEIRKA